MLLGTITGKTSTLDFKFLVKGNAKKFQYVQVPHEDGFLLAQILEIEKEASTTTAHCTILKPTLTPPSPGATVEEATDDFITRTLKLEITNGAYIGTLNGRNNIPIHLDFNKLLTKHVAVLAKTGGGKCITPDTEILLSDGEYIKIGSLVDQKLKEYCIVRDGIEFHPGFEDECKVTALSHKGNNISSAVINFVRRKAPPLLYEIVTRTGKRILVTPEHNMLTLQTDFCWIEAQELKIGDYMIIPKPRIVGEEKIIDFISFWESSYRVRIKDINLIQELKTKEIKEFLRRRYNKSTISSWFAKKSFPLKIVLEIDEEFSLGLRDRIQFLFLKLKHIPSKVYVNKEFTKLMGYFLAEGHNTGSILIFSNENIEIQKEFSRLCEQVLQNKPSRIKREGHLLIYNKLLAQTLKNLGFTNSSSTKYLHPKFLGTTEEALTAFLNAFIDCDGHVGKESGIIEVILASRDLITGLERIFLRFGIVCSIKQKIVNGKVYHRLTVMSSSNLKKLNLHFHIKHKQERFISYGEKNFNPNIDVIPYLHELLKDISQLLRLSFLQVAPSFHGTVYHNRNLSFSHLTKILNTFRLRIGELHSEILELEQLFSSLPNIDEEDAWQIFSKDNRTRQEVAEKAGVHGITVGRIANRKNSLSNNIYKIAEACSDGELQSMFIKIINLDQQDIIKKVIKLCKSWNIEIQSLCKEAGFYDQRLSDAILRESEMLYSDIYKVTSILRDLIPQLRNDISRSLAYLSKISRIANEDLFYDTVTSIKKIECPYDFVYDLETDEHNFVANNIVIHNSYVAGTLLEELLEKNVPVIIIDPHGEYNTLRTPNTEAKEELKKHDLVPKAYSIQEFAPNVEDVPTAKPLKLNNKDLNAHELMHLLPAKLSNAQLSVLYSALKNIPGAINFHSLIMELEAEDSSIKYSIMNVLEYLQRLNLFSEAPTRLTELVQPGKASIINLKGTPIDVQEIIVYKLAHDLFNARKKGNIPPFFFVLEEAQNYCPERSFGEAKSSAIIRQIASEGRKFGISLAVISQRPSRIEKNVLSQANTHIILKVTNPHDTKAISNSLEGITTDIEKELQNLPIGTAVITGISDMPLFVDVRPRKTKHGGESVSALFHEDATKQEGELLPLVQQHLSAKDMKIMHGTKQTITLVPCLSLLVEQEREEFPLLLNLITGEFVLDSATGKGKKLEVQKLELSKNQQRIFDLAIAHKSFKPAELFAKSGLQFSELYDTMNGLVTKGMLIKKGETYTVNNDLQQFENIKNLACYASVDYESIVYDQKLDVKIHSNDILSVLQKFVTIKNEKDCWLAVYK